MVTPETVAAGAGTVAVCAPAALDAAASRDMTSIANRIRFPASRKPRIFSDFPRLESPAQWPKYGSREGPGLPQARPLPAAGAPSAAAAPRSWWKCLTSWLGRIAQLVEQLTLNQRVQGSSPCAPTNHFNGLGPPRTSNSDNQTAWYSGRSAFSALRSRSCSPAFCGAWQSTIVGRHQVTPRYLPGLDAVSGTASLPLRSSPDYFTHSRSSGATRISASAPVSLTPSAMARAIRSVCP